MKTDTVTLAVLKFARHPSVAEKRENQRMAESPRRNEEVEADYRIMNLKIII